MFIVYPYFEKNLEEQVVEIKIFLWNSLSEEAIGIIETLPGQTQSGIALNFPRLKNKFILNNKSYQLLREVSVIAIIQMSNLLPCQI